MRKISIVLLLSFSWLFLLIGCQGGVSRKPVTVAPPEQEEAVKEEEVEETSVLETEKELSEREIDEAFGIKEELPWPGLIEQRLDFYRQNAGYWQKLDKKLETRELELKEQRSWQQCGDFFQEMVGSYRKVLQQDRPLPDNRQLWDLLGKDFNYLQVVGFSGNSFSPEDQTFKGIEECRELMVRGASAVIKYHAARRQYDEEIEFFKFLKNFVNREEIPAGIKEKHGRALLEKGSLKEALDIFMEVLAEDSERPFKSLALRRETLGYFIAMGDFDRARLQLEQIEEISSFCREAGKMGKDYEELLKTSSDRELKLYSKAYYSWLASDRQEIPPVLGENVAELKQYYPGSEAAGWAARLMEQVEKRVEKHVYRELSRAVELVREDDFSQALDIIDNLNRSFLPEQSRQKVKETEAAIRKKQAEEKRHQEKMKEEALAAKWEKAVDDLDRKEYDEALESFRSLLETSYRQKARGKIKETIRLAASAKRQKAAELFIRARDAETVETRVNLLKQSRQLLLEIRKKYPETEIIDKVRKNLEVVEETLRGVEPDLLKDAED